MLELNKAPYNLNNNQINQVRKIVDSMSLEEKIGQLFFVIGQDESITDIPEFIKKYKPGGMMYRPDKAQKIKRQINLVDSESNIPLFFSANLESGGNGIIYEGTWFGNPLQISATNDSYYAYELGNISGKEARQVGINMTFSPIVDIDMNFKNPITNTRTFGNDKEKVLLMSKAQINGLIDNNIIPVIKHFPGDGVDDRDQHLVASVNSLNTEEWMKTYGEIYKTLIHDEIPSIMVGHIMQPAWERKLRPQIKDTELLPASSSDILINGLLRDELGFNGLAITDATPMIGYNVAMPREKLLPTTINAGIDMILFNKNIDEDYSYILNAVNSDFISQQRLNEAVTRIIATKVAHGIILTNEKKDKTIQNNDNIDQVDPSELCNSLARKSITLVKDRDKLLPMTPLKYPRIRLVILGDSDDGGFKEGGKVTDIFKKELEEYGFEVSLFNKAKLDFHEIFEEGVADLESKFDLALYVANIETASNQTTNRINWIQLMAADAPWFMKSIPTIFISTANPYHLYDIPNISTYINAYTGNASTIKTTLEKMVLDESFVGINPIDPFCNDFTTRI